jgi:hypothetical protein
MRPGTFKISTARDTLAGTISGCEAAAAAAAAGSCGLLEAAALLSTCGRDDAADAAAEKKATPGLLVSPAFAAPKRPDVPPPCALPAPAVLPEVPALLPPAAALAPGPALGAAAAEDVEKAAC